MKKKTRKKTTEIKPFKNDIGIKCYCKKKKRNKGLYDIATFSIIAHKGIKLMWFFMWYFDVNFMYLCVFFILFFACSLVGISATNTERKELKSQNRPLSVGFLLKPFYHPNSNATNHSSTWYKVNTAWHYTLFFSSLFLFFRFQTNFLF